MVIMLTLHLSNKVVDWGAIPCRGSPMAYFILERTRCWGWLISTPQITLPRELIDGIYNKLT